MDIAKINVDVPNVIFKRFSIFVFHGPCCFVMLCIWKENIRYNKNTPYSTEICPHFFDFIVIWFNACL